MSDKEKEVTSFPSPKNRAYAFQHTSAQADLYPNITTSLSLLVALIKICNFAFIKG